MNDFQLLPVGAELAYTLNFAAEVPAAAAIDAIAFTVEPVDTITLEGQTNDLANSQATIRVSGASHGQRYILKGAATLNNGETLTKAVALIGYNG